MKKIVVTLLIAISLLTLTGCTTTKSYVFDVATGDRVELKLKTNDGYDITSNLPFSITKNNETLSQGTFITIDGYNSYINAIENTENAEILETKTKNGLEYTFYSYNDSEWNYIVKISNSNTGLLIGNPISEKSARDCFSRLTITKK